MPAPRPAGLSGRLRERLRAALADGLGEALWLFVTLRLSLSLLAFMAALLFNLPGPTCTWDDWDGGPWLRTTGLEFRMLGVWQQWDACWYERVAILGYRPGDPSVAFFPLYPLLMYVVGLPLAGDVATSGLIVAGVGYVAGMDGLYRLIRTDFDEEAARRTVLYLSVFPAAFFLFAPFTESLFLALTVWSIYLARRGAWAGAGLAGFLAGLTRLHGALLVLPLGWEAICQRRAGRGHLGAALAALLPIGAVLTFLAYGRIAIGWTMLEAQQGVWGQRVEPPWTVLAASWTHIREHGDVVEAANLCLFVLFALLLLYGARRLPLSYTIWAAPQVLLIALHVAHFSPLISTSRYALVVFPAFTVLALLGRHRRLHYSWLIVSLLLLGFFFYAFLSGPFVA